VSSSPGTLAAPRSLPFRRWLALLALLSVEVIALNGINQAGGIS
jgi:hypothetical protein